MQNISNFAPPVSSGYTISPNNSRIILTDSGDLIIDPLSPQDTGTYTFRSTDHGGATLTITVDVYGKIVFTKLTYGWKYSENFYFANRAKFIECKF